MYLIRIFSEDGNGFGSEEIVGLAKDKAQIHELIKENYPVFFEPGIFDYNINYNGKHFNLKYKIIGGFFKIKIFSDKPLEEFGFYDGKGYKYDAPIYYVSSCDFGPISSLNFYNELSN